MNKMTKTQDKEIAAHDAGYRQALIDVITDLTGLAAGDPHEAGILEAIAMIRENWGVRD